MEITKKPSTKLVSFDNENLESSSEMSNWLKNFTSKATKTTYSNAVRDFLEYFDMKGAEDLRMTSVSQVITWRDWMIGNKVNSRTINNRLSALSSLFNHLREKQLVSKNPVNGIRRPKVNQSRVKTVSVTQQQVRSILDLPDKTIFQGLRDATILYIYFYTGCRRSEVRNLSLKNIYEDDGYRVMDFSVKGGKDNVVPINKELELILDKYINNAKHLVNGEPNTFLFTRIRKSETIKPLNRSSFNRIFSKYISLAGLPKNVTPHSARATFITEALRNNCAVEHVQNSVGHANVATTLMYDKRDKDYKNSASFAVKF